MLPSVLPPSATDHVPVLADDVRRLLALRPGETVVDCTFGAGGHAALLAADLQGRGRFIAIDRDPTARTYFERFRRRTGVQARQLFLLVGARGEHDDRHGPGSLVGSQPAGKIDPGLSGQHPVQQYQIGQGALDQVHRLLGVVGAQWLVAGLFQVVRDQLLNCRFVFDHEDGGCHGLYQSDLSVCNTMKQMLQPHDHF